ncbi:hypothetical protein HDU96_004308 [Phlyctochytrium bullatum]|nr:hypothetical protein HDU96_004308 [Phlyctochytrium bullatum]
MASPPTSSNPTDGEKPIDQVEGEVAIAQGDASKMQVQEISQSGADVRPETTHDAANPSTVQDKASDRSINLLRKSKTKVTPISHDPESVVVEDATEEHHAEVISISRPDLTTEFDGNLKDMLDAIAQATSAAGGGSAELRNRFAKILGTKELSSIFNGPRLNPDHPEFDQVYSLKVFQAFFSAFGMEYPEMPVVFKDLSVLGDSVTNTRIPTVADPIKNILFPVIRAVQYWAGLRDSMFPPKLPKAKALTGRSASFKEVQGTLLHAGMGLKEIRAHHRGEIHYTEEGDPHFPSLTVRQTLDFVLNCRFADAFIRERVLDITLKLFGLTRCKDTVVGDHELRGVSGGEKKRVSLAEAFCLGGSFAAYDGCTKGLDAASALDFVKALRNIADILGRSVVASCYQASDAMFDLFDKVIVLHEGYCVYFGPIANAVQYFEALDPRMKRGPMDTKAEFVTSVATRLKNISAEDLHKRYCESEYGKIMQQFADEMLKPSVVQNARKNFLGNINRFRNVFGGVKEKSTKGGSGEPAAPRSSFTISLPKQMALLLHRQWLITLGAPSAFIIKIVFNILMALIVGSVFLRIPTDSGGAFTRGGAIFFGLLFNSISALSEIPQIMNGRPILYKHADAALYRPAALFYSNLLFSFISDSLNIMVFSVVFYFMVGLQMATEKFFIFYLSLVVTNQSFSALMKMIGNAVATIEEADQIAGTILTLSVLYNGYMIPMDDMKPWLKWFSYINPLSYGFRALMINEFSGLTFSCSSAASVIPYGPGLYNDPAYQTCTLAGAKAGSLKVDGIDYLTRSFSFDKDMMWWYLLIDFALFVFFLAMNTLIVERVQHGSGGASAKFFKKNRSTTPTSDPEIPLQSPATPGHYVSKPSDATAALTWTDIVYRVPHPKEKKQTLQLLDHVNGYALPGKLTALMGSSGAGKTTLLDVIARRKTIGTIEGEICVGGTKQDDTFFKISGYCEQMDVHNRYVTVREALTYSAELRQPKSVTLKEKHEHVENVIDLLELRPIADALVGDPETGTGLSMEERKRLTIGVELAAKPRILFLDEPTSGLDEQAASNIVRMMQKLAAEGHALLVTIHQPSASIFSSFDRLLLLGRGGKTIYFGELGQYCQTLVSYFERYGAPKCVAGENPAEYMLDCIGAGTAKTTSTIDWVSKWKESSECKRETEIIRKTRQDATNYDNSHAEEAANRREVLIKDVASSSTQFSLVMRRMFTTFYRSPEYNIGRTMFQLSSGIIIGLSFFQTSATPLGLQNRVFALFTTAVLSVVIINLALPVFIAQRSYAIREITAKAYPPQAFAAAVTTVEIPFAIVSSTFMFLVFYWTVGLNPNSDRVICFYVASSVYMLWAVSFGQMIGSFVATESTGKALVPLCTSVLALFAGVTIRYDSMPDFYKHWLYWIDPYHYYIETLLVNDLQGVNLYCDEKSTVPVPLPPGTTCEAYFAPYLTKG